MDADRRALLAGIIAEGNRRRRRRRLLGGGGITAALLLAGAAVAWPGGTGDDDPVVVTSSGVRVERLGGPDRYATAAAIADATFPGHRFDAILARGDDFADALVASGPANAYNGGGPILLTPHDHLPDPVAAALDQLGTERLVIVGDEEVVSAAVEAEAREHVRDVERVGGADRYETAARVAATAPDLAGTAFVVSGERFADALAAGPLASMYERQTFLTRRDSLPAATERAIRERGIRTVVIVGGTDVVSTAVEARLRAICVTYPTDDGRPCLDVSRVAGADRYETAVLLADQLGHPPAPPVTEVTLARGDAFPDAVAGAPIGGEHGAPTLFTEGPDRLGDATRRWLRAHAGQITTIRVLGDAEAISDAVVAEAIAAVG